MPTQPLTVMIADDDRDDREFFEFLFSRNPHFRIVGNYDSAATVIEQITVHNNIPDVLIMDFYMPLMTGEEALIELRLHPNARNLNIFIVSGVLHAAAEARFSNQEKVKFLQKPVTLSDKNDLPGMVLEAMGVVDSRKF